MFRERVIDTQAHRVTEYDSVRDFLDTESVPPGIITIYEGNLPIDLLVSPADSDTTIFFFHGAIENHFNLPVLSGLGISGGLNANRVFVSDPSLILDERLLLAWYAGNYFQPNLQEMFVQIFSKICRELGSQKAVFFGGSGGGFASLFFAHHFDNSLALVFNPQTNIANYTKPAVTTFAKEAFGIEKVSQPVLDHLPEQVTYDLCSQYSQPTTATVAYMQNHNDKQHLRLHLNPFEKSIHTETKFLVLEEPWQNGHTPPPKSLLSDLLNLAAASTNWHRDLAKSGFKAPSRW